MHHTQSSPHSLLNKVQLSLIRSASSDAAAGPGNGQQFPCAQHGSTIQQELPILWAVVGSNNTTNYTAGLCMHLLLAAESRPDFPWKVQLPAKCAEFYGLSANCYDGSFPTREAAADHYLRRMVGWQGPERMQAFIEQDPDGYVRRYVSGGY